MSYVIFYDSKAVNKKNKRGLGGLTCLFIVLLVICGIINQFASKQTLELLFPWISDSVQQAFLSFRLEMDQGTSFYKAFETFCAEVVENGQTKKVS